MHSLSAFFVFIPVAVVHEKSQFVQRGGLQQLNVAGRGRTGGVRHGFVRFNTSPDLLIYNVASRDPSSERALAF